MIDFSALQSLTIPEGVVVKIESGSVVLWKLQSSGPVVLEVEKITADTYAGETSYTEENFILLDIYPKTNGTVSVAYGGLTKTITDTSGAAKPNAQQVFFGTFNGVTDSTETPAYDTLMIDGDCDGFAVGAYKTDSKGANAYCACIKAVTSIGSVAFIPAHAFHGCSSITGNPIILKGATSIEDYTFKGCSGLTGNLTIPEGVTSIGQRAFQDCSGLTGTLTIPEGVTSIGNSAFYSCSGLTGNLTIPEGVTSIGSDAFHYCSGLTGTLTIPSTITTIEASTFDGCSGLTGNLTIPEGVISIGESAFYNCDGITGNLTIPEGVTSIGKKAFYDCSGLTGTLTIPSTVTSIGAHAINNCSGLTKVVILATTPPVLSGTLSISSSYIESFTVPSGCGDAYKTAEYWSSYADKIVEAS